MLIDTHCHLTDEKFEGKVEEVIAKAKEAGVGRIIVPTVGPVDARKAIRIADENVEVFSMVGVHPEVLADEISPIYRDEWLASEGDWLKAVEEIAQSSSKVVGIGEIGLDFHHDKDKKSKILQMMIFRGQLQLACDLNLPVAIHMRDAEEEMTEVINDFKVLPRGQFHCWAGSDKLLNLVLERGCYVSFCGNITYPNSGNLRNQAKIVPGNRLLLETDSPYLAPEPVRGSQNIPSNVKILAEYLAQLLGKTTDNLINQTTQNALCLYFGG